MAYYDQNRIDRLTKSIWHEDNEDVEIYSSPTVQHPDAIVYAIRANNRVKFGTTRHLKQRLVDLGCGCPDEYELLATIPGHYRSERAVHEYLADERVKGEWFSGEKTEELVKTMQEAERNG